MDNIGIVGAGIAGLHLALWLQQRGIVTTLYSERSPAELLAGSIPNFVVRFDQTRQFERALGVDHWDKTDSGVCGVQMVVGVQPPIRWQGTFQQRASAVDMRIFQAQLMEDF